MPSITLITTNSFRPAVVTTFSHRDAAGRGIVPTLLQIITVTFTVDRPRTEGGASVGEQGASVELGARAAKRAEPRMLIDGQLTGAADGAEFDNISPATGRVLVVTAAAGPADMDRAIAAARRAFDDTEWSTDRALRARCLAHLQAALEPAKEDLREELVAEVGCPVMSTGDAQLDWPLTDSLRYPARLIDEFDWERTLDGGGLFGDRNVRTVVKEPVGVVAAITPSNYPIEVILNKLGPALDTGNTV
ncbi:MAG: aldehyde dehydrogenase family protein, partial [Mycolicibacterium aromaticivorans]|nr:aldehyde dehydrogenase family protein [Mycolicibacterium aromaticivorans]